MRSQSGGSVPKEKASGTRSTLQGAAAPSNSPIMRPPVSSRKYPYDAGSSSTGRSARTPSIGSVMR